MRVTSSEVMGSLRVGDDRIEEEGGGHRRDGRERNGKRQGKAAPDDSINMT